MRAVVFDWGGTLCEYVPVDLVAAWRGSAALVVGPDRVAEVAGFLARAEDDWWAEIRGSSGSGTTGQIIARGLAGSGVEASASTLAAAVEAQFDAWSTILRLRPDCVPAVRRLRRRGLAIGLLTNSHWPRSFFVRMLRAHGSADLFDAIVVTSELPFSKPDPRAFRTALDALGIERPEDALYVDRPYEDVWGAQRAGMPAVLLRNPHMTAYDVRPQAEIYRLEELPAILERWPA